ncbi:hypothetical protein RA307_25765 [Xanthobacteraceae bacterium Astr-EGSB]|uniref:hypothetical protein n=1 Tax=Astrobacterium formosum TaxID=3069710 RepID=UPI0027B29D76|nr:hypothetical protein [Xanthobacteraceae bacterium Astr-EGSB]
MLPGSLCEETAMIEPSLQELENDVEATRARLTRNLRTLRSPTAREEFTDALKHEALAVTDGMVDRTRSAAQTQAARWIDDIKARAADNPFAVLAIAAGIGWRLMRDPPIATALVGAGLFSLWRSGTPTNGGLSDGEYVDRAVKNLKQTSRAVAAQVSERAGDAAANASDTLKDWSGEVASAVRQTGAKAVDTAVAGAADASDRVDTALQASQATAVQAVNRVGQTASDMQSAVKEGSVRLVDEMSNGAGETVARLGGAATGQSTEAAALAHSEDAAPRSGFRHPEEFPAASTRWTDGAASVDHTATRSDTFNQVLLGAAGVAVAAALGVALQRRLSELETSD